MKQRISSLTAAILLIVALIFPASAQSPDSTACQLNRSPLLPQQLQVEERAITLSGIPDLPDYRYIKLNLVNSSGEKSYSQVLSYQETLSYTDIRLPAGQYTVNLYCNDTRYGSYPALSTGAIVLDWDGQTGSFVQSPAGRRPGPQR